MLIKDSPKGRQISERKWAGTHNSVRSLLFYTNAKFTLRPTNKLRIRPTTGEMPGHPSEIERYGKMLTPRASIFGQAFAGFFVAIGEGPRNKKQIWHRSSA
jgi:hypothetical protein